LETGDEHAGMNHILGAQRAAEFNQYGIASEDIVDVVFQATTTGKAIGVSGRDRTIFVTYRRRQIRVAVTVASNGFIIGAYPSPWIERSSRYHGRCQPASQRPDRG
jgi:hypothetical protein